MKKSIDAEGVRGMKYREEYDTMGSVQVPEDAYYGAQTQRAVENFAVSGLVFHPSFLERSAWSKNTQRK